MFRTQYYQEVSGYQGKETFFNADKFPLLLRVKYHKKFFVRIIHKHIVIKANSLRSSDLSLSFMKYKVSQKVWMKSKA